jgi:hypothetical protein
MQQIDDTPILQACTAMNPPSALVDVAPILVRYPDVDEFLEQAFSGVGD